VPLLGHRPRLHHPAEPTPRDQHEADAVVQRELQGLRDAVVGLLADGVDPEHLLVELERPAAVAIGRVTTTGRAPCDSS